MSLSAQPPLPAPPILTPPSGWIGLLGMKSSGVQPGLVTPSMSPVQEMSKFYEAGGRQTLMSAVSTTGLIANNTVSFGGANIVPAGKCWIIDNFNCLGNAALGVAANARISLVIADQAGLLSYATQPFGPFLTGEVPLCSTPRPETPWILLPGYSLNVYTSAPAALTAGATVILTAHGIEVKL